MNAKATAPEDPSPPTIIIDPECQARIPPIPKDERKQLEENLKRDGCRDALVVWRETNILLDGHHRYAICQRLGIKFTITYENFKTREAALEWIDLNQLGRRNLTPDQMSLVRGRVYQRAKGKRGGARANRQNVALTLATQHGVTERTIERDGQFAEAVDKLKPVVQDIEQRVMAGQVPSKQAVVEAARTPARAKEILMTPVEQAEAGVVAAETKRPPHVTHNSGNNEWFTPAKYVEAARAAMNDGIDLDPATCEEANDVVQAARIFTAAQDGLTQEWSGRVWLNPPYVPVLLEQFARKLVTHVQAGEIEAAVVLTNNASETKWFQLLASVCDAVCFPRSRIRFRTPGRETATPLQGQTFLYFGTEPDRFLREFKQFGVVFVKPSR